MTDRNLPPALPDDDLRAALRALLAADAGGEAAEAPDEAARRVETLRGSTPEASPADLALLGDLGHALAQVEAGAVEGPSQAVLAAAREAFGRDRAAVVLLAEPAAAVSNGSASVAVGAAHVRLLHGRRPSRMRSIFRACAAVLIVGVGVAWFVRPRAAEAEVVLSLAGVDRYAAAGAGAAQVHVGGRLEARPGVVFAAGKDEMLALRLSDGGRLVLRGGERLEVVAAEGLAPEHGGEGGALLRLQGGEVLLACEQGSAAEPVALLISVPRGQPLGVFVLLRGAAHVAQPPGHETDPAVALSDDAIARFFPFAAGTGPKAAPIELRGPTQVVLSAGGTLVEGEPARALFRDLEVFGGPRLERRVEPFVSVRVWRVVSGRAERGGEVLTLRESVTVATGASFVSRDPLMRGVVVAWTPDPSAGRARTLRLLLRGPAGLTASLPDLGSSAVLRATAADVEPGLVTLDLPLPDGWATALPAHGELRLALSWPGPRADVFVPAAEAARFEGAFLGSAAVGSGN